MEKRLLLVAGVMGLAVAGFAIGPIGGVARPVALELPDLDGDGHAERLQVRPRADGLADVTLAATAGKATHDVLTMPAVPGGRFVARQGGWGFLDAGGRRAMDLRLLPASDAGPPDLVVIAGPEARRYRWIDRGFLKLDATAVIPGFAVGLLLLGDSVGTVQAIAGPPGPDGRWWQPTVPPTRLDLTVRAGRVAGVRYASSRLATTSGVRTGADPQTLATHFPGRRDGQVWRSPLYGLTAHLGPDGLARAFTIERPQPRLAAKGAEVKKKVSSRN